MCKCAVNTLHLFTLITGHLAKHMLIIRPVATDFILMPPILRTERAYASAEGAKLR